MKYLLLALCLLTPQLAHADLDDRVGRLERTLELLQRKMLSNGASSPLPTGAPTATMGTSAPDASFELRLSTIEEQIRDLQGMIERIEYRQQRQEVELQKMAEDIEFRLQQLEPAAIPSTASGVSAETIGTATEAVKQAHATAEAGGHGSSREHYDEAFKLLGAGEYAQAADSFTSFIATYKNDALIGNAYYWLGETYYVRGDYVRAAEQFRLGFEAMPKGPKANDNLLKLAMSLSQIQKEKEACVVLKQLVKPSDSISATIRRRASAESDRISCK